MNKLLEDDLVYRAHSLYGYFSTLIKKQTQSSADDTKFEFEIKDNNEINGKSCCKKDVDHVEINSGVIELYYDYFTKVMEDDKVRFLQHLKIDKDENILKKCSSEGIIFKNGIVEIFDSKIIDDSKAKLLVIFTSRFIVLHELGHILNGHCKLLANELHIKDFNMYFDKVEGEQIKKNALDIRTMEMDADAFATTQSIFHVMLLFTNFDSQVNVKIKPEDLFYWWSYAIRSHFLTCEDKFMDREYYENMTHLPSSARWVMIYATAIELIDFYDITLQDKKSFKSLITQGAEAAETKFNAIKFTNYSWTQEVVGNSDFTKYSKEVNSNWAKIRKSLQEYARLPLSNK